MDKKILVGYVTLEKEHVFHNNQFQYAASFEDLKVSAGTYPVYTYKSQLKEYHGRTVVEDARIGYTGTIIASNVGGKPNDKGEYNQYRRGYCLADAFIDGYEYFGLGTTEKQDFDLSLEWELVINEGHYEGKRFFTKSIVLKKGEQPLYFD